MLVNVRDRGTNIHDFLGHTSRSIIHYNQGMMNFGWKKKAERLRMVLLSSAHQTARKLPPGISEILAIFARVAARGGTDGIDLQQEIAGILDTYPDDPKPLWEPIEVYGWRVQATMYLRDEEFWWLVHAVRKNEGEPSNRDVTLLDKILNHLGAEPRRHMIIGPFSSPPGEPALPFGWWTWQNRWPLYEIQVNPHKEAAGEKIRIVPLGSRQTDGYQALAMLDEDDLQSSCRSAEHTRGAGKP
jgi:hypothetical protein